MNNAYKRFGIIEVGGERDLKDHKYQNQSDQIIEFCDGVNKNG